ncbi:MAG: undecaprenyldiphospho-muramoylpentapeptide beta-N-acetylglucosaminyltransferase [Flavobacteriaceae bacterium]|jgi:UDP-N-acetylglucosamine--N-acetylmuramyl-(pentapeptide) pyrophosphoryl-undecaprenol N-acetylglucosamine transferase|uniref:UDP-N-acetylglucosamine--N-acetylmuramyl-(pentapeptide) pyrophosphoryl-undecaprenol N-acetylglucosamine transferase n=2 Tax=Flavobacterium TaxID=237 RepID=A0ABR7J329_9FLAO|nr:undecaprenyldiphospho-muramoylpentapeptide beta-N-acetylglucosaminyltransferase [Flavobacterium kayseriense]MBC5839970.1 undecaprenyldiphospho-muramoylpentapeptide beta-N-acetylglucosaminyltransferase [Flavobacterium kayseriense]MBC5847360.1 undecaprenyldiphospho-muramoylpentapeptide beta-N-acetylglucosaminyltransferase [Flavobacterium kayseriense]MBU0940174.1 undecaprenyldiphospho-muramoylpentapeptide beta-N-acetylglucosaminyltransferase [Bacteroidota bacterium]MBX9889514.1 undecaprenyldiph
MKPYKFILSGGGTGGHIYPAIAIANELKIRFPDAEFLFVGAKDKMEMQKVPQAGYAIKGLWIAGLQRQINFKNAMFPFKLLDSLLKSKRIIKDFKPDVVIGTGGFASGPLLQVANSTGVPTVVQEQNSYPGITNKLLSKKAGIICVAYENLERFFPKEKIILTGNPVRQDLIDIDSKREEALTFFKLDSSKKTLLVLGGSLGSRRINQLIEKELETIKSNNVQVIWQCGKLYFEEYKKYSGANVQVVAFIEKMDFVYAAADIIISRAGASSVSELCIVGKPVIFIPSPNVAEDHQTKNANAIVQKQGALLLKESSLDVEFGSVFDTLLKDEYQQQQLGQNIKRLALPQATSKIVDEIVKLIKK